MSRIDDLSDAEFMKLQAEYGDSLPFSPICTVESVQDGGDDDVDDDGAPSRLP